MRSYWPFFQIETFKIVSRRSQQTSIRTEGNRAQTWSFCKVTGGPICLRVARSQKTQFQASPPATTVLPSGLQARLQTNNGVAFTGGPKAVWVDTSQKMTVPSMLPEIRIFPSGAKARLLTWCS